MIGLVSFLYQNFKVAKNPKDWKKTFRFSFCTVTIMVLYLCLYQRVMWQNWMEERRLTERLKGK